jgi:hypothetical protein
MTREPSVVASSAMLGERRRQTRGTMRRHQAPAYDDNFRLHLACSHCCAESSYERRWPGSEVFALPWRRGGHT